MGKMGKPRYGSRSLLNMTLSLHHCDYLGWVIQLDGYHTVGVSYHPSLCFGSMLPIHFSVSDMFKRSHPVKIHSLQYHKLSFSWPPFLNLVLSIKFHLQNHYTHFMSLMWDTSRPSCDESLLVDINTLSKNLTLKRPSSTLRLAYINGRFLTSSDRLTSMVFYEKTLYGVRHQIIHSHHAECTAIPWGSLSLSVISLVFVNNLHHWLVIRQCFPMFGFKSHIHMVRLMLERMIERDRRPQI